MNILITTLAVIFVAALCAGIPATVAAYNRFLGELPSPESIASRNTFKTARILDRNGRVLYEIIDPNGGRRTVVGLKDISDVMQLATISVEDGTFYVNPGFDLRSIARALWLNRGSQVLSGASTITQQLVKNTLLSNEVSFQRKLKEAVLAWEVSRRYSKEQILEMYLNEVYYGNMAYGVEAAAQTYFGKRAADLSLPEASLLAGLVQSPADYDPFTNLPDAKARQRVVLDLMAKYGLISAQDAEAAKSAPLVLRRRSEAIAMPLRAPHFAMYVRELVERTYGKDLLYYGGLEITTTLDLDLQQLAEDAIGQRLATIKKLNANNAALVSIDPRTGEIIAMVGSADYFDDSIAGQVNVALSKRQPGSTLKPFVYLTAFAKGYTPGSILQDVATVFPGGYQPENHDKTFRGPVPVRQALANSLNVPAVKMLQVVGIDDALTTMRRAGIVGLDDPGRYGLTLALGGGEVKLLDLTFAYATLANNGIQIGQTETEAKAADARPFGPVAIQRIVDDSGKVVYEYHHPDGKQVLDPQLTYLITSILSDDAARQGTYGRHSFLELSRNAAAKTGTTDEFRDGWTIGYTPDLVTGIWVGNSDNTPMLDVYGVSGAGYIWHNFMERALDFEESQRGVALHDFVRPPGIEEEFVCADTGLPAAGNCRKVKELFAASAPALPTAPAQPAQMLAEIIAPATGATVSGLVDISGSALAGLRPSYSVDFGNKSGRWTAIAVGRPFSVTRNLLARWDTSGVSTGDYQLRLTVTDGQDSRTSTVDVRVIGAATPTVTATRTLTATVSATRAAGATRTGTIPAPTASPSARRGTITPLPSLAATSTPAAPRPSPTKPR